MLDGGCQMGDVTLAYGCVFRFICILHSSVKTFMCDTCIKLFKMFLHV